MGSMGSWEPINFWPMGSRTHQFWKERTIIRPLFSLKQARNRGREFGTLNRHLGTHQFEILTEPLNPMSITGYVKCQSYVLLGWNSWHILWMCNYQIFAGYAVFLSKLPRRIYKIILVHIYRSCANRTQAFYWIWPLGWRYIRIISIFAVKVDNFKLKTGII